MGFFQKLFSKKKPAAESYDPALLQPAVRASICTGERVAGFVELATGHFREVMLLRNEADLEAFKARFDIRGELKTIY